jgi:hypothetical protein
MMSRDLQDSVIACIIVLTLLASFGASTIWEIAIVGAIVIGGVALLLRKNA